MGIDIDTIPAGRELDALIAENVFGFRHIFFCAWYKLDGKRISLPNYSTDISDAWLVVHAFRNGWNNHAAAYITIELPDDVELFRIWCNIIAPDIKESAGFADTAPLAICRAALKIAMERPQ